MAAASGGRIPAPKDPRELRKLQQKEIDAKVKESEAMQLLLKKRTDKEAAQIQLLEQEMRREELHKQKLAHREEIHMADFVDRGMDLDDLRRRRPQCNIQTQTE